MSITHVPRQYMINAVTTAIYPRKHRVVYPALGLAQEALELAEAISDYEEAEANSPFDTARLAELNAHILSELGDCAWYAANIAHDLDVPYDEITWTPATELGPGDSGKEFEATLAALGKVAGLVKKGMRDHDNPGYRITELMAALSHSFEFMDYLAVVCGSTLDDVLRMNVEKLSGRAARGTLGGDGENR